MDFLLQGVQAITWQQLVMWVIGVVLIWLAIAKDYEPTLLLPMGFGAILVNIPLSGAIGDQGIVQWLFKVGIEASEAMPLILFIGIGAMIDFGPLLSNPRMLLFGAGAQFGIFVTVIGATMLGFNLYEAASIGIIGAADGPTSILVAQNFFTMFGGNFPDRHSLVGPISVAAYSYMALVPVILPFTVKLITTKKERRIRMDYKPASVSRRTRILFPIIVTIVAGLVAPDSVSLVGFLMFGNLIRECGRLERLSLTAQNELANLVTLLLGVTIAFSMKADQFVNIQTLGIMALGLIAFIFDMVGGVFLAKFLNLFLPQGKKFNPMIGAAGISAFPMASRVVHKMGIKEDNQNFLLMHAAAANVSGQIASVVAGGMILALVPRMLGY